MNPDTNVPPTLSPDMQPEPMPIEPLAPQTILAEEMPQPITQPEPAPYVEPVPVQPIQAPQPLYTPQAASQQSKGKSKKKLFIIAGILALLVVIGAAVAVFTSKATLIGSLSKDSYEGLKYQRPTSWIRDTSDSTAVGYHPQASLAKDSAKKPTYALKMNVSAKKNVFQSTPNNLKAADKKALQTVIDKEITQASTDLLPAKSEVGCDTNPVYQDKPKKITLANSFLAVKYSFSCKSGSGSKETTFYYVVLDLVPKDKDIEYILNIGAASKQVYDANHIKIDSILNSISF